ncbi:MAG: ParA family protein [Candidatus Methanomethylophilaceae archaeon]
MHPLKERVTVVCGHYGTGKTNLSINLAMDCARSGESVTLVDMDIVNPYFRSADYSDVLTKEGIRVIGPNFANTNLDTPSLPGSVRTAIEDGERVIIDVGGDDAGTTALAVYSRQLQSAEPEVLYVVNMYRSMTTSPEEAVTILGEIERTAHLKATGVVNNSHLKQLTTADTVDASLTFADTVCGITGLPLRFTTVPRGISPSKDIENLYPIDVYVRAPWE